MVVDFEGLCEIWKMHVWFPRCSRLIYLHYLHEYIQNEMFNMYRFFEQLNKMSCDIFERRETSSVTNVFSPRTSSSNDDVAEYFLQGANCKEFMSFSSSCGCNFSRSEKNI